MRFFSIFTNDYCSLFSISSCLITPFLAVGVTLDMKSLVYRGELLEIECDWMKEVALPKRVVYYRKLLGDVDSQQLWEFQINNTTMSVSNSPHPDVDRRLRYVQQEEYFQSGDFMFYHVIYLWHVAREDMGEYWCTMNLLETNVTHQSHSVNLTVYGKDNYCCLVLNTTNISLLHCKII